VAQRTHEIGVRMALGAAVRDVLGMELRQGFIPVSVGLAIGVTGGLGVSRLMRSVLYGVTPNDPITYGTVILTLAAAALAACIVPALRAARIDPLLAIRSQ
jgi:putative ABC transport system permease protein